MVHYYDKKQTSELKIKTITSILRGELFTFHTASGIFSGRKVDAGTKLLIDTCIMENNWMVLDLGCGYGAVGITLKKLYPKSDIFMTDINERAIVLAERNSALHKVMPHLFAGNMYGPIKDLLFDTILINPPYVAGRKVVFEMLTGAKEHLKDGGILQVVARHQKGGKTIANKMKDIFDNVTDHSRSGGYHVYISKKTK